MRWRFANAAILSVLMLSPALLLAEGNSQPGKLKTAAHYLAPWKDKIEATRLPVVLVDFVTGGMEIWNSKVGGAPYLPKGERLPEAESGRPMYLLAQINFEELPELPDYPRQGIVQIFITEDDYYGANMGGPYDEVTVSKQRNFKIVYRPTVIRELSKLEPADAPKKTDRLPFDPTKPRKMRFRPSTETINSMDRRLEEVLGTSIDNVAERIARSEKVDEENLRDLLIEHLGANDFKNKIGGYPSFSQSDHRAANSRLRLFLQLVEDEDHPQWMMWGDSGTANFFIDPTALSRADFTNVLYNWDCF